MTHEETASLVHQRNIARKKMRTSYRDGNKVEGDRWKQRLKELSANIQQIAGAQKEGV